MGPYDRSADKADALAPGKPQETLAWSQPVPSGENAVKIGARPRTGRPGGDRFNRAAINGRTL